MLIGTPVVLHKLGCVEDDFDLDNVIGYVDSIVSSITKDEIYGNVFVFKDNVDLIGDFVNYYAYMDSNYNIMRIAAISIK